VRYLDSQYGSANGFDLYRIADDSTSDAIQTFVTVAADSQVSPRWQTTVRFGSTDQESLFINPSPTGQPFDPFGFGANYLGQTVTLSDAEGRTVTGQGILDFGGAYPQSSPARTTRRSLFGQATYQATSDLAISGGGRFEHEAGYDDPEGDPAATRNNGGAFVEARATLARRVYVSAGIGVEHNEAFDTAYTPRLSVAAYLRNPSNERVGETKLTLNAGKGIKAPSVFQSENSLFELVNGTPAGANVPQVGPERSRSFDAGVEQVFASSRLRARVGYFSNTFEDLLEYLGQSQLIQAGVPPEAAAAAPFGAYINSGSFDAQGLELSADAAVGAGFRVSASYTYLDAEVTEAFGASASFNPSFPNIPIGAFSPLVGARPFRRPANSGTLFVGYATGPLDIAVSGFFSGKRDDSTFLSDGFFGDSLLLPNKDLDPSYQKIDLSASYRVHPRFKVYTSIENLFDQDYAAVYGFPSLPFTIRGGMSVGLGGDR
jgi:iron complex outermembrane receptor protein/vitamin B12 transporter